MIRMIAQYTTESSVCPWRARSVSPLFRVISASSLYLWARILAQTWRTARSALEGGACPQSTVGIVPLAAFISIDFLPSRSPLSATIPFQFNGHRHPLQFARNPRHRVFPFQVHGKGLHVRSMQFTDSRFKKCFSENKSCIYIPNRIQYRVRSAIRSPATRPMVRVLMLQLNGIP